MEDYVFFGGTLRWQPSEIDKLRWSWRKEIKQAYKEKMAEDKSKANNGK